MYITPRVQISQEFLQVPVYAAQPLPAFIIGPQYSLTRYSDAAEKPFTALAALDGVSLNSGNSYIPNADTTYDFPNRSAGGDVDYAYTKVFAESVIAQYFPLEALSGGELQNTDAEFVLNSLGNKYTNRVRFSQAVLQTANGYSRSSWFSDRDVAINDAIEITDNSGRKTTAKILNLFAEDASIDENLASVVAPVVHQNTDGAVTSPATRTFSAASLSQIDSDSDLLGQYITITNVGVRKIIARPSTTSVVLDAAVPVGTGRAYTIGGAHADQDNLQARDEESTDAQGVTVSGTVTGVTATNTTSTYVGHPEASIFEDTYIIKVQVGGSATTARFSVASDNGAFPLKGYLELSENSLILDDSGGNSVSVELVLGGSASFSVGSTWTLTVSAGITAQPITASGTYTGTLDMVYKVVVERGGSFYDGTNSATCARLIATASDIDISSVILPEINQAFNIGSFGVTAAFTDGSFAYDTEYAGLIAGDVYYIPVKAERKGKISIVEFSEVLSEATLSQPDVTLNASLFLTQTSIRIPEVRDVVADTRNWAQEDTYITVNSGITTYNNQLVVSNEPVRLPIVSAKLFVEHRDLLQDNINSISSVTDLAGVKTLLGTIHPDNPLAQGVYDAVLNAQGQVVYFIGVASDNLAGYNEAIKISEKNDKVYSFVPLTFDRTIQDAVVSHVNAYSTKEIGRWRIAWLAVEDKKTAVIYDLKADGYAYTATITDDPSVTGQQYKLVTIPGAKFIEDGVRPNDTIRINYRLNADGLEIYDEYVVDHIRTNTTLTLTKALATAISQPVKAKVIRNYTKSERAYNIAHIGADYNNRRVRCVFPDSYKYGSGTGQVTKQGYVAAAGLAGLRSGVVPHQGLTNAQFLGADDLSKVVLEFNQDDLNTMAEQGIWLITQEVVGATPYVRHQLTTDTSSLNTSEDSITTNVDSISYALKRTLAPYIGKYNVNPENVLVVREAIINELTFRATGTRTVRAGNQLTSFTPKDDILKLEANTTFKDRIDVEVRLNVPYPMNVINLALIV